MSGLLGNNVLSMRAGRFIGEIHQQKDLRHLCTRENVNARSGSESARIKIPHQLKLVGFQGSMAPVMAYFWNA